MAINYAADLANAFQKILPEQPFQVGESQLKPIKELYKFLMQQFNSQTGIHYSPYHPLFKNRAINFQG